VADLQERPQDVQLL